MPYVAGLLAMVVLPGSASAARVALPSPALVGASASQDPTPDLGALWRDAQTKLETADYRGAIVDLTRLYELVVQDPEAGALRDRVRLALQEAHVGAYGVDGERDHLVAALDLLDRTLSSLPPGPQNPQRAALTSRRETVQALLDAHQEPEPISEIQPTPEPEPEPEPDVLPEPDPLPEPEPEPMVRVEPRPAHKDPLIVGGAVLVGAGAVGTALLIGGLVSANNAVGQFEDEPEQREDARQSIARGNTLGIVGGTLGGVLTVSGAILLGLGLKKRQSQVAPLVDSTSAGISWSGRF